MKITSSAFLSILSRVVQDVRTLNAHVKTPIHNKINTSHSSKLLRAVFHIIGLRFGDEGRVKSKCHLIEEQNS